MRGGIRKKLKVLRIIIADIAVDVMNNFFGAEVSTNHVLHHQPGPSDIASLGRMRMGRPFEINTAAAHELATSPIGVVLHSASVRKFLSSGLRGFLAVVPKTAQHLLNVRRSWLAKFGKPYLFNMFRREFTALVSLAKRSTGDAKSLHPILDGRKANAAKIGYNLLRKPLIDIFSAQPGRVSIFLHHTSLYHIPYSTTTFTS